MRRHYTPIGMAKLKTVETLNAGEDVEYKGPSYITGRNVKWQSFQKTFWWSVSLNDGPKKMSMS